MREAGVLCDMVDAQLLIGELVSNAVMHGTPPIALLVAVDEGRIRVSVEDADAAPLAELAADVDTGRIGGRGLRIVDRLADSWGCDREPARKSVWFSMKRQGVDMGRAHRSR